MLNDTIKKLFNKELESILSDNKKANQEFERVSKDISAAKERMNERSKKRRLIQNK